MLTKQRVREGLWLETNTERYAAVRAGVHGKKVENVNIVFDKAASKYCPQFVHSLSWIYMIHDSLDCWLLWKYLLTA